MDLPTARLTKPSLRVELIATQCAAHSAKLPTKRRYGSILLLVAGAVCLASAFTELQPLAPIAFATGFPSHVLVPARGEKVAVRAGWWDKVVKTFGLPTAEDEAKAALTRLTKEHSKSVAAELSSVDKSMKAVLAAQAPLRQAKAALRAAKQQAPDQAAAAWNQSDEEWASALEALVATVVKDGVALSGAVEELGNATKTLTAACAAAEAAASERATKAEALVSELDAEGQKELSGAVAAAAIPLGEGDALRVFVLGKAAAIDASKVLEAGVEGELVDAEELTKELSAVRTKRQSEEKAKQKKVAKPAPKEPEETKKPAEPAKSKEGESNNLGFVAAFVVAAGLAAYVALGKQGTAPTPTKSPAPAPVAVVAPAPEVKKVEAPKPVAPAPAPEVKKVEAPKPAAPAPASEPDLKALLNAEKAELAK